MRNIKEVTLDSLIAAGYDSHLTAFAVLLPPLVDDYDRLAADDPRRAGLKEPIASLRGWDHRTSADSVPAALATFSGQRLLRRIYGAVGKSFVAAVEFGPTMRAKAIMAGGERGEPASPHFADQAQMFMQGRFRDVLFSPADVAAHAERSYRP